MMADLGIADCSRLTEHTGHHGCECGANTPLVQPPMNDTVAVREDAENRRDPDVVAICDELDALRITEVKLRDALARAAAAIKRRDDVGLLNRPTLIDEDGVDHIIDALVEVGPWDEIDGDGTEASIIADHIRDLPRLLSPPPGEPESEKP